MKSIAINVEAPWGGGGLEACQEDLVRKIIRSYSFV